jgi:VIT1/CCC1 family predicted Fe2+/Mn2+ transporter
MSALERWHEEAQAAWVYRALAAREADARRRELFLGLAEKADEQAAILLGDVKRDRREAPPFRPSLRARVVVALTARLGVARTRTMLAAIKVRGMSALEAPRVGHAMPVSVAEVGGRHRGAGAGGALRAAVFGANDGLVSNASLILGFAGASAEPRTVLLAGVAGLLAGAFSMAAGEWVSVRSQRELYEHQIAEERDELARYPAEEAEELALIYAARGVPHEEARALARRLIADPEHALDTLAREELGLNPDNLGSPGAAALSSFAAFASGALVPLVPFLVRLEPRVGWASALSGLSLFALGAAISLFSGKGALRGGLRMLAIGAAAGAATFVIGRLLGVGLG